jgi:hypothetical protein
MPAVAEELKESELFMAVVELNDVAAAFAKNWREQNVRIADLEFRVAELESVLQFIAAPKRPDGTYNNCREACERLAREALTPK